MNLVECDIILRGPNRITGELITVPVIISVQITPDDIIRAVQTAGILRAIGFDSEPMVFGRNTDNQTLVFAASQSVMVRTHKDWR